MSARVSLAIEIPQRSSTSGAYAVESVAHHVQRIIKDETSYCNGKEFPSNEIVQLNGTRVRRAGVLLQSAGYNQEKIQAILAKQLKPEGQMRFNSLVLQTVRDLAEHDASLLKTCENTQDLTKSLLIQVLALKTITG